MARTGKRSMQIAALGLSAALFTSGVAFADNSTDMPLSKDYPAALEQFKADRQAFNQQMRMRDQQINQINQTLNATVNKIKRDAKKAMSLAKSPEDKSAILTNQQNAIASAIIDHDAAIVALGTPPVPPVEPMRPWGGGMKPANPGQPSPTLVTPAAGVNKKGGAKKDS